MPTIRQQIIDDRVSQTAASLQKAESEAFERFAHATFTGISIHSFDESDLVDGSQDKQIDAITIVENDGEAEIFILSMKYTSGFSSNALILMRNGLNWIFNKSRSEIQAIANLPFRDKALEIRSVLSGYGPSNVSFRCAFLTNGLSSEISSEYQQELTTMQQEFDNGTFRSFDFASVGADELVDLVNAAEKKDRRIDVNIPIRYDANSPSLIKYHSQGLKGLSLPTIFIVRLRPLVAFRQVAIAFFGILARSFAIQVRRHLCVPGIHPAWPGRGKSHRLSFR